MANGIIYDTGSTGGMANVRVPKTETRVNIVYDSTKGKRRTSSITSDVTGDEIRLAAEYILEKALGKKK